LDESVRMAFVKKSKTNVETWKCAQIAQGSRIAPLYKVGSALKFFSGKRERPQLRFLASFGMRHYRLPRNEFRNGNGARSTARFDVHAN